MHSPFEKQCPIFFETRAYFFKNELILIYFSSDSLEGKNITQVIINMPNYFLVNVFSFF